MRPSCPLSFGAFLKQLVIPLLAALSAGLAAWGAAHSLPHGTLRLAVGGIVGGIVYLGVSALINRRWLDAMRDLTHLPLWARR